MNQPYHRYQQTGITTSNPMKLVLMLYDGAINFLKDSIDHLAKKDIKNKNLSITKARNIIEELNNSLNTEIGGEFALHLRKLYFFMNRHLLQANLNNNAQAIREVIQLLSSLREAWQEAYNEQIASGALSQSQMESESYRQPGIRI
jgi:flagellar secretion chaperone FliS